jgi:hypothetical protein
MIDISSNIWEILDLAIRAAVNLVFCLLIVKFNYSRKSNNREFIFALYAFNVVIFALCAMLRNVEMGMASGFGLFALFGLLNYRTEVMKTKDMTYLLVVIAIGFINGLYKDVVFLNILIVTAIYFLETSLLANFPMSTRVRYEKIELISPHRKQELIDDLKTRTGLNITDVTVDDINYLNDTALITIYHKN